MSDLHKQALKNQIKNKPPIPKNFQNDDDDSDNDEEQDKFEEVQQPHVKLQGNKPQPIKADHNITHNTAPKPPTKKIHDYTPLPWTQFFDEMIYHPNGTSIYVAGSAGEIKSPIFLCLHGAGHSAMSFATLASEIKQFATLVAFDFRGHGQSKIDDLNLSTDQLVLDVEEIVDFILNKFNDPNLIIVGHSMGGAIAAKATLQLLKSPYAQRVQGLIVIDVVEGTAMEALPFMEQIVNARPKFFKSYEQAIQWSLNSSTLHNLQSARVSIPPQLVEQIVDGQTKLVWKVDLMKTAQHWVGWFNGLTNDFLDIRLPKILMLAEKERLDKDLTVAQMQGKFKLVVLMQTGHSVHEDDPKNSAWHFYDFIVKFRIPLSLTELKHREVIGIGKFHPTIANYPEPKHNY